MFAMIKPHMGLLKKILLLPVINTIIISFVTVTYFKFDIFFKSSLLKILLIRKVDKIRVIKV